MHEHVVRRPRRGRPRRRPPGWSPSSETTVWRRGCGVSGVPVPLAPAVSRKYSASVMVPPARRSSPVAETVTSWQCRWRACRATLPLVVCGPVLGRLRMAEPDDAPVAGGSREPARTPCACRRPARSSDRQCRSSRSRRRRRRCRRCRSSACRSRRPVVTASSTTSSAWVTVDPPVVASLRSAVTVTGDLSRPTGSARRSTCVDTGPTPSVLGGGRRRVEEGQHAAEGELQRVGGRLPVVVEVAGRPRTARPSPPGRSASSRGCRRVAPGSTARATADSGYGRRVAVLRPPAVWSPPSRLIECVSRPDVDVAQQHACGPGRC